MQQVQDDLLAALTTALEALLPGSGYKARFEIPKVASHGDWAVTAAMQLAKPLGRNPREVGEQLRQALGASKAGQQWLSSIEIAGPGFLNLRLTPPAKQQVLREILEAGHLYGQQKPWHGQRLLVEFVSANPTGPLHVGHGRQAALGDAICNLFASQGWHVHRELFAVAYLRHEQDLDLQAFQVSFDQYYLESSLYTDGKVDNAVASLQASGHTYAQDGALWLRSTDFGDDKDRVMRKSDGSYTYFVPDVAYHLAKWQRGFTKVINIQGTDHHGTIARVRAGLQAASKQQDLNIPAGYPDYLLHTMVRVMRGGEEVKISKRAGSYVTLRDLIDWTSKDAVRFFLLSRKADTEYVFDVDLARAKNNENPVYYVQYAHARICSVIAKLSTPDVANNQATPTPDTTAMLLQADMSSLDSAPAQALMMLLSRYPQVLAQACADLAPHDVTFYLRELAACYHSYYDAERILVEDETVRTARAALIHATAQVLKNGLNLLGVSAPEVM